MHLTLLQRPTEFGHDKRCQLCCRIHRDVVNVCPEFQFGRDLDPLFSHSPSNSVNTTRRARAKATGASHAPCRKPSLTAIGRLPSSVFAQAVGCTSSFPAHKLAKICPSTGHRHTVSQRQTRYWCHTRWRLSLAQPSFPCGSSKQPPVRSISSKAIGLALPPPLSPPLTLPVTTSAHISTHFVSITRPRGDANRAEMWLFRSPLGPGWACLFASRVCVRMCCCRGLRKRLKCSIRPFLWSITRLVKLLNCFCRRFRWREELSWAALAAFRSLSFSSSAPVAIGCQSAHSFLAKKQMDYYFWRNEVSLRTTRDRREEMSEGFAWRVDEADEFL